MWHDTPRLPTIQALYILAHRNGVLSRFYIVKKLSWLINHDSLMCHDTCATQPILTWHDTFVCDVTPLYVTWLLCTWYDWFIYLCDMTSHIHLWREIHSVIYTYLTRHPYVRPPRWYKVATSIGETHLISSLIWRCALALRHCQVAAGTYVTWLIYSATTPVTRLIHMWHDSFTRDMTHLYVRHDSPHRWHNIVLSLFNIVR